MGPCDFINECWKFCRQIFFFFSLHVIFLKGTVLNPQSGNWGSITVWLTQAEHLTPLFLQLPKSLIELPLYLVQLQRGGKTSFVLWLMQIEQCTLLSITVIMCVSTWKSLKRYTIATGTSWKSAFLVGFWEWCLWMNVGKTDNKQLG